MIPEKLKEGDKIRIISPSRSLAIVDDFQKEMAVKRFEELGLVVTFSENSSEMDVFSSSSIKSRLDDLHCAFEEKDVKAIFTTIGGYNSNQLLKHIDYNLIKNNPKIFCGYSDITALSNAIYSKTGLITYSGPHFRTLGMKKGINYTINMLKKCLMDPSAYTIKYSNFWSDDDWGKDQEDRNFIKNKGPLIINEGRAEGNIIGGNLCTFNLLQGTEFMPKLKGSILFIEEDAESNAVTFDRDLQSLLHQPEFSEVKGLVIGRFQKYSKIDNEKLLSIVRTKEELINIPIIANLDFGHTTPFFTFPIGGVASLNIQQEENIIKILKH